MRLPALSLNWSLATRMVALPVLLALGVKIAVYWV